MQYAVRSGKICSNVSSMPSLFCRNSAIARHITTLSGVSLEYGIILFSMYISFNIRVKVTSWWYLQNSISNQQDTGMKGCTVVGQTYYA